MSAITDDLQARNLIRRLGPERALKLAREACSGPLGYYERANAIDSLRTLERAVRDLRERGEVSA